MLPTGELRPVLGSHTVARAQILKTCTQIADRNNHCMDALRYVLGKMIQPKSNLPSGRGWWWCDRFDDAEVPLDPSM